MDPRRVRKIRDRCIAHGVPFFFKQWGGTCRKTWLDFRVVRERYRSASNFASRVELFGKGSQRRHGLNGSLSSSVAEAESR